VLLEQPVREPQGALVMTAFAREWVWGSETGLFQREPVPALRTLTGRREQGEPFDVAPICEKGPSCQSTDQPDRVRGEHHKGCSDGNHTDKRAQRATDPPSSAPRSDSDLDGRRVEAEQRALRDRVER